MEILRFLHQMHYRYQCQVLQTCSFHLLVHAVVVVEMVAVVVVGVMVQMNMLELLA